MEKKHLRLWLCLLVTNLVIIWGNSMLPGEISGAISNGLKDILAKLFPVQGGTPGAGGGLIRKLAHFTEFTCLGICLSQVFRTLGSKKLHRYLLPLLCGVGAACIDETIQRFVPNRGPSIFDVGLDSCGVVTGIVIISLIHYHKKKKQTVLEEK